MPVSSEVNRFGPAGRHRAGQQRGELVWSSGKVS